MAQRGVQVNIVLVQAEKSAVVTLVGGEVRPVVLGIDLGHRRVIGRKAQLRGSRQQLIGTVVFFPSGFNPVVQRHVLIVQVYRGRALVERARPSSACPHDGGVQSQLVHRAVVFRLQRQDGRKCPAILQRRTARSQIYPAKQEGGIAAAGRSTDAHRRVGHQHVHAVNVGLRFAVVASTHQQAARLALHLRTRQGLERPVEVTVRSAHRHQLHRMHIAPPAVGRRRASALHHHFVQPHTVCHRQAAQGQADGVSRHGLRIGSRTTRSTAHHQNKE